MYRDKIIYLLILLNETFFAKWFMHKCKEKHILEIQLIFQNPFAKKKLPYNFSFFLGNMQAYLLSAESIAVQISVLRDVICPQLDDPAGCAKGKLTTYFNVKLFLVLAKNIRNLIWPIKQLLFYF